MAYQSDPMPAAGTGGRQRADDEPGTTNDLADAMVTKGPVPGHDLVAVNPDPRALVGVRIALTVEAILLAALGIWGLIAALAQPHAPPSGAPVLVFHFTWPHAVLLLVTALLAIAATSSHGWALRYTTLQAVGYGILFIVGAGRHNWFADPANDALHAGLAIIGLALVARTAARAMSDDRWYRRRARKP